MNDRVAEIGAFEAKASPLWTHVSIVPPDEPEWRSFACERAATSS